MGINVQSLAIPDVKVITTDKWVDSRGFLSEVYSRRTFEAAGIVLDFVQDNHTLSALAGVVRGLHYQVGPHAQCKLIRVVRGRLFDVAVDIRQASPTFKNWVSVELSADKWNQVLIPTGFAHGFCTLEPNTEVIYKITSAYSPNHEFGIRWNDPEIGIAWPVHDNDMIISEKDAQLPLLREVRELF